IVSQKRIKRGCLRRIKRDERIVRSLRDRGIKRDPRLYGLDSGITLVATEDGVDRIENCDVNNSHRATGATGSELLAKCPDLAGRYWCVIKAAGVNRDRVPAMNGVERVFRCQGGARRLHSVEARTKEI